MNRRRFLRGAIASAIAASAAVHAGLVTQSGPRYFPPSDLFGGEEYQGLTPDVYAAATDLGNGSGSSEANAMDLVTALQTASPGDIIGILPVATGGIPTGTNTGNRFAPAWIPNSGGTSGNPIIIVGKYDPTQLTGVASNSSRTELRNGVTSGFAGCPTFGTASNRDFVTYLNIFVNEEFSRSKADTGPCVVFDSDDVTIERCVIKSFPSPRGDWGDGCSPACAGDNHNVFRIESTLRTIVRNCRMYDLYESDNSNSNWAAIMLYGARDFLLSHLEISNSDAGIYIKGTASGVHNYGTVEYCRIWDIDNAGIRAQDMDATNDTLIRFNLVFDCGQYCIGLSDVGSGVTTRNVHILNNTVVSRTANVSQSGCLFIHALVSSTDIRFARNISFLSGNGSNFDAGGWAGTWTSLTDNLYYNGGSNVILSYNGTQHSSYAAWATPTGETSGASGNPNFLDAANDDFRRSSYADGRGCYLTGIEEIGVQAAA